MSDKIDIISGNAQSQLKSIVERIERQLEEKKEIQEGIKEVYAEAKGDGFDTKAIRAIIRLRSMNKADRDNAEAMIELYANALGGL